MGFVETGVGDALILRLELIDTMLEGDRVFGEKPEIRGVIVGIAKRLPSAKLEMEVEAC